MSLSNATVGDSPRYEYLAPVVEDLGDLASITADEALLIDAARLSFGLLAQVSTPLPGGPGGGGTGGVLDSSGIPSPTDTTPDSTPGPGTATPPDGGGVLPGTSTEPASQPDGAVLGSSGGGGSAGGAGGDDRLPFTGFAVMAMAAVGAGLVGTGTALRRIVKRNHDGAVD